MSNDRNKLDRRRFIQTTAAGVTAAAIGGCNKHESKTPASTKPAPAPATAPQREVDAEDLIRLSENPAMEYRRLGRTNFMASRIVAGWSRNLSTLPRQLQRGVNYFDTALGYGNYEVELKDFLKRFRNKVWLTSKATDIAGHGHVDKKLVKIYRKAMESFISESKGNLLALHEKAVEKQQATGEKPDLRPAGKRIAKLYTEKIDESLGRMGVDNVDSYFVHGIEIPWIFDCLELWDAYEKVRKAGKVKHFGFSVHKNQKPVLAAAVEANRKGPWKIDLIMVAAKPANFDAIKPELTELKKQDVGIIAMKTKGIANRPVDGREKKFKSLTDGKSYNEWERAKLWMLHLTDDLIDAVIAAMNNMEEIEKDVALPSLKLTTAAKRELKALVKLEMAGTCHLCGHCEKACPEEIAVADMIRYHAYIHQYDDKELARQLYAQAGYDPAKRCTMCGRCADVCPSDVRITELLQQLSADMA